MEAQDRIMVKALFWQRFGLLSKAWIAGEKLRWG